MTIESELLDLQDAGGMIHARDVVAWAEANPNSDLNAQFDWDDESAAGKYRLNQARRLIAIHIRFDEAPQWRGTINLVADRKNGGGYRRTENVMRNEQMRAAALRQALLEANRWRENYRWLSELARVFAELDAVEEVADTAVSAAPRGRRRRAIPASAGASAAL
jgi:hypothetical protein